MPPKADKILALKILIVGMVVMLFVLSVLLYMRTSHGYLYDFLIERTGFQQFEKFRLHYFLIETKLLLNGVFVFFPLLVYCVFYFRCYEKRAGLWSVLSLLAIIALLIACLLTRNRSVIASLMAIMAVSAVAILWSQKMMNNFFGRFAGYIRYGAPAKPTRDDGLVFYLWS